MQTNNLHHLAAIETAFAIRQYQGFTLNLSAKVDRAVMRDSN
jgi:hypothetical protein